VRDLAGRFAYDGLERTFHEKARLGIMASLLARPQGLLFTELKELCSLTDGNLSRHIQVLSDAGFVEIWKGFERKKPHTLYRVSPAGRERFLEYLGELERVVKDMASAARRQPADAARPSELPPGWIPV
jgi:DNA-binding transcriptional ArsR family regulator